MQKTGDSKAQLLGMADVPVVMQRLVPGVVHTVFYFNRGGAADAVYRRPPTSLLSPIGLSLFLLLPTGVMLRYST